MNINLFHTKLVFRIINREIELYIELKKKENSRKKERETLVEAKWWKLQMNSVTKWIKNPQIM